MKWAGRTVNQKRHDRAVARRQREWKKDQRLRQWHKVYAYFPTQMDDGQWVWLEVYQRSMTGWTDLYGEPNKRIFTLVAMP